MRSQFRLGHLALLSLLALVGDAESQQIPPLTVVRGATTCYDVEQITMSTGTLSCSGNTATYNAAAGGGVVTSVTATAPLASSGGATPDISVNSNPGFTGTVTATIGYDKAAAGTLAFGTTTATGISVGGSGVNTTFGGAVLTGGIVDRSAAAALNVGTSNATSVGIGSAGITATVNGALSVLGNSTLGNAAADSTTVNGSFIITQGVNTSGSPTAFLLTAGAHTTLAASTEDIGANFNFSATKQFATGALALQREALFQPPTLAFVGASTVTIAATVAISGAPIAGTNATISNAFAFYVQSGASRMEGSLDVAPDATSSGTYHTFVVEGAADTNQTAGMEKSLAVFEADRTVQFATGAIVTQRETYFTAPTYAFVGASTITNAATVAIAGAPVAGTNATLSNSYSLWLQGGVTRFDGNISLGANVNLTCAAGTTAFDLSAGTGTFKPPTGIFTFQGKQAATATANNTADPGNGGAISVATSGVCNITSTGAGQTRTVAIPTFEGQMLTLAHDVDGGDVAVTFASGFNVAGNTVWTTDTVGEYGVWIARRQAGTLKWAIVVNDGGALS